MSLVNYMRNGTNSHNRIVIIVRVVTIVRTIRTAIIPTEIETVVILASQSTWYKNDGSSHNTE